MKQGDKLTKIQTKAITSASS